MIEKYKTQIKILFGIRICLWIVALASTVYWISYSIKLHANGIYAPEEYSPLMRPVLYTCVGIAIAVICLSFVLHAISIKIKRAAVE
jgi:hypothetical protein